MEKTQSATSSNRSRPIVETELTFSCSWMGFNLGEGEGGKVRDREARKKKQGRRRGEGGGPRAGRRGEDLISVCSPSLFESFTTLVG